MFSQFKQAVESLSSPLPDHDPSQRSRSLDLHQNRPPTPLSLTDTANTNLRKSLSVQRPPNTKDTSRDGKKLSLEDRLRARLVTVETPNPSPQLNVTNPKPMSKSITNSRVQPSEEPSPTLVHSPAFGLIRPRSPCSVPLPDSPVLSSPEPSNPAVHQDDGDVDVAPQQDSNANIIVMDQPLIEVNGFVQAVSDPNHDSSNKTDVESLQERLKQVEQRFLDVSTSFKMLQADKAAADSVLRAFTPLYSIKDSLALQNYLEGVTLKASRYQEEINELNSKLQNQGERLEELRSTHQFELHSHSELIEQLRSQVHETEALFKATQDAMSQAHDKSTLQKDETERLRTELEQAKGVAKEEEEKRVKAISLLKTVRQKLVKTEKERDDAIKETLSLKQREQGDKDKGQVEKLRMQEELNAAKADKEKAIANLKAQLEKELSSVKERYEKESTALKGQFELELLTLKASHNKELTSKTSQLGTLENSLNNVTKEKNQMFDQLQLRQAEVESAQSHLESLQNQNTELQYQLHEGQERISLLSYELLEAQREQETLVHQPTPSAEEVAYLISSTERKYESRLAEMRNQIRQLELDRNDGEAAWSRKLREKAQEADDLKRMLETNNKSRGLAEEMSVRLNTEKAQLQDEVRLSQQKLSELISLRDEVDNIESTAKLRETELSSKIQNLEQQLEQASDRETQLRLNNKTLREELKKIQSSIALLERQRGPGVGYWASSRPTENRPVETRTSLSSNPGDPGSRATSPSPGVSTVSQRHEEDVNLEYLRNVILQFLEHNEMRPNLVRVISSLLRFTPQETRRLLAKV